MNLNDVAANLNPLSDFDKWLAANQGNALVSAMIIVLGLGAWSKLRPYAIPVGVIIMCLWFFKWQRKGGKL